MRSHSQGKEELLILKMGMEVIILTTIRMKGYFNL
jgi:hypothetical protein